ncbi:hypothetical protein A3C98_04885 [Candidatus Roizmanbacteria bacterium RIFCSPHIGHO2_02_FULL_37_15]|nr:MAG: hypothetical protein A2859_03370 [Candidatus Roizmanbacteria bacterium RIFCSPHIGHO2_01_FULL_37_16b]OGK22407.1 MAG: hypothetical protein A3C98_04885 [Candidatus Roizmanbacteria bacterium RIFCSPHIGHO2_02_FULL_37_15]OGK32127.1 MAG: hypothetical protein A3F57_03595 [Candidatus Roizmanbacteria bacterium RIFCSPHIGHO2_12_FULL_36_11]OGK57851.1 MAG: hypothetical protein A3I50_02280 [Candidatus Roizmanbacteria bacterium RIFCSPLOWO2_02_FULL_37_9]
MKLSFPYESEKSQIFGTVRRPIANVSFWSKKRKRWFNYTMIVDTGADYTLLPYSASEDLTVDLEKDAKVFKSFGIGGSETVYLIQKFKIKIGKIELLIPVGFLSRDDIPPLLGRQECLNKFNLLFSNFITSFDFIY